MLQKEKMIIPDEEKGHAHSTLPGAKTRVKKLLGQTLIEEGLLKEGQLEESLKIQARSRDLLGAILIKLGYVSQDDIAKSIARIHDLEYIGLEVTDVDEDVIKYIARPLAERHNIVPLKIEQGQLHVVCDSPLSPQIQGNLQRMAGMPVSYSISGSGRIRVVIKEIYETERKPLDLSEDTAIIHLVDNILEKAIRERASDIHVESKKEELGIRFRIDGVLRNVESHPVKIAPSLISRIKVLANLNIAEKRSPQDGAMTFSKNGVATDIRVSILPNIFGEKAVLRLLSTENRRNDFESLGMEPDSIELFKSLISKPHGIILLASPTGSGKSTTLYVTLRYLQSEGINITTVEDPVEYKVDGVTQVQVDQAMKVTFPSALRSILRQDPDIIMIGEIRDRATADIALQAALTGHLVLATIHTNDAPSALTRLVDMGCEPFLVSSTVRGIMAQRLVRMNCTQCREEIEPTMDELNRFGLNVIPQGATWYRGKGCRQCRDSGYRDRIAICEICDVNREIQKEVVKKASSDVIRDVAIKGGMRPLFKDGIIKVNKGIISPEELMRVTLLD
jgi:type IV pilus assembly protein PilB